MKKVLLIGLAALLAGVWVVHRSGDGSGPARAKVSESEISIHGTPVCVYFDGEDIEARVGHCRADGAEEEAPAPSIPPGPFRGNPGMFLPPGHPPIGEGATPGEGNAVRI